MPSRAMGILILIGVFALVASKSLFTVSETQLAIKFTFGEIVNSDYKPGLHTLVPFVHQVKKFDKRIVTDGHPSETFLTSEGKILNVDFYVKWRIANVAMYYRSTGGIEQNAGLRLSETVKDALKGNITRLTIQQVVASERSALTGDLLQKAGSAALRQLGVELIDVRIRRIDLPDEVTDSVYQRMKQSFAAQANKLRAEGRATAETLRSQAERERTEILARALRDAERIRGDGDAQAADIQAGAYSKDPEFYAFYRSLEAYRKSLGGDKDVMVVAPDGEFFRYLKKPDGR